MEARVREASKRLGDETQASSLGADSPVRVDATTTRGGNSKVTGADAGASANTGGREREGGTHSGWLSTLVRRRTLYHERCGVMLSRL
jgi:hypothetical protein